MSLCDVTKELSPHGYGKENHQEASLGATQPRKLKRQEGTSKEDERRAHGENQEFVRCQSKSQERLLRGKERCNVRS